MLSKQSILDATDLATVPVSLPEWGGDGAVRMLTGAQRQQLYASAQAAGSFDMGVFAPLLVAMTLVDEAGTRLFADDEAPFIAAKSAIVMNRVFLASSALNKLNGNAVDEAEKNSSAGPSVASS